MQVYGQIHKGQMHDKDIACRTNQELYPNPKSLVAAEAYLSAKLGPNISDFFIYAYLGVRSPCSNPFNKLWWNGSNHAIIFLV